jgi:hypothetical protein
MAAILPYVLWTVLLLLALSLGAVLAFGVRALVQGKVQRFTIGSFVVPVVLFGVLTLVFGDWIRAGIVTLLVMLALAALGLVLTGARGMIS